MDSKIKQDFEYQFGASYSESVEQLLFCVNPRCHLRKSASNQLNIE